MVCIQDELERMVLVAAETVLGWLTSPYTPACVTVAVRYPSEERLVLRALHPNPTPVETPD